MTISERFDRYVAARLRIDALKAQLKDLENEAAPDEAFVKDWFRSRKPDGGRYRGVIYTCRTQTRLDVKKARLLLGAKAGEAEVTIHPERLELDREAKAVRDAGTAAVPLKPIPNRRRTSAKASA